MLFEMLVLSGAQVGSEWTSILKKRQDFRNAFAGFDAETVANFTDKQMLSISSLYGIDMSRIRGIVDNSIRILEVINFGFKDVPNKFFSFLFFNSLLLFNFPDPSRR